MMKPITTYLIIFVTVLSVYSCDPDRIYESNINIPNQGWSRANHARFEVEITDTISPCNVYVNVRNNTNYRYMELWLFIDVRSPAGTVERDTAKIMLADHRGKWMGHGLGNKFDTRKVFRKNVRFPTSGTYIFEYEQASRDEPLIGIDDIGLRIEKVASK
jgi:gliding motility-associated lipoprotein GldH